MSGMEKPATDIYTFSELRKSGFTYIDKTDLILPLVDMSIGKQFFLARPRRFGKSLLVSTMRSLFEGRRELFQGLAIEPKWDWNRKWPVIHLDMGSCQADTVERLRGKIAIMLRFEAQRHKFNLPEDPDPCNQFRALLEGVANRNLDEDGEVDEKTGRDGTVVLLVDEYDKPLLGHLGTPEVLKFRDFLKEFYSIIKTCESKQRFAFITGISKFSKVSIFSDLNNLKDRTMERGQATILGYTTEEILKYYPNKLKELAAANNMSVDDAMAELKRRYDGYRFKEKAERVLNPVSVGLCFESGEFRNYWAATAVPTFLVDMLDKSPRDLQLCEHTEDQLGAYEPDKLNLTTLLFQTGYLTIVGCRTRGEQRVYTLDFPNAEVRGSFLTRTSRAYTHVGDEKADTAQRACIEALYDRDLEKFFNTFRCLFANMPYDLTAKNTENVYQAIMVSILWFIGVGVRAEVHTNDGAIDAVFETDRDVYLLEMKRDESAAAALRQIRDKNYCEKYRLSPKPVTAIGVSFDAEHRTVGDWRAIPAAELATAGL